MSCEHCRAVLLLVNPMGLPLHWLRHEIMGEHGYVSHRARNALDEGAVVPEATRNLIADVINTLGMSPWLDLTDQGEWRVHHALHGAIPKEV